MACGSTHQSSAIDQWHAAEAKHAPSRNARPVAPGRTVMKAAGQAVRCLIGDVDLDALK